MNNLQAEQVAHVELIKKIDAIAESQRNSVEEGAKLTVNNRLFIERRICATGAGISIFDGPYTRDCGQALYSAGLWNAQSRAWIDTEAAHALAAGTIALSGLKISVEGNGDIIVSR